MDRLNGGEVLAKSTGDTVLRDEREKRRMSREELAEASEISAAWIRDIETKGENPGFDARARIRKALEHCPVHKALGVKCEHKLPVPPDEELYGSGRLAPNAGPNRNANAESNRSRGADSDRPPDLPAQRRG